MASLPREDRGLAAPSGAGSEPRDPVATTLSDLCRSINGFGPTPGNRVVLLGNPSASSAEPTFEAATEQHPTSADFSLGSDLDI